MIFLLKISIATKNLKLFKILENYGLINRKYCRYSILYKNEQKMYYCTSGDFSYVLYFAAIMGCLEITKYLIEEKETDIYTECYNALSGSLEYDKENIVHYLLTIYSIEKLERFINQHTDKIFKYLKNKQLSKYEKIINVYRSKGIDIFDLIENEKF